MTYKEFVLTLAHAYRYHAAPWWSAAFMCYVVAPIELSPGTTEYCVRNHFKALDKKGNYPHAYRYFSDELTIAIKDWLQNHGAKRLTMVGEDLRFYLGTEVEDRNILRAMWLEKYAETL